MQRIIDTFFLILNDTSIGYEIRNCCACNIGTNVNSNFTINRKNTLGYRSMPSFLQLSEKSNDFKLRYLKVCQ